MNLVRGTFRFITGVAAKPTYQIKTPHASISVRGTIFDVFVQDDGAAWLLLIEGSVRVCNDRGRCQVLDEPGKLVRIDDAGNVGKPTQWKSLPGKRDIKFERAYPFFSRPTRISPEIPDFTDEIVSGVSLPPIIYWPRHPRRPHWPPGHGDGKHPGGDGKWPGGGKHPGSDGKPPYGTDGKGTTAGTGKGDGPAILRRMKDGKLKITRKTDTTVVRKKDVEVKTHRVKRTHTPKVEKVTRHKTSSVKHTTVKHSTFKATPRSKPSTFKAGSFKSGAARMSTGKSFGGGFGGFRGRR